MLFSVPPGATVITGAFGFAPAAYSLGRATEGAQFRIEEEQADGSFRLLYSQTLTPSTNPDDRGMKPFAVPCPNQGTGKLILRARAVSPNPGPWELTCWGEIGFK